MNLLPYACIPGHGLPHPVNDPDGHLYPGWKSGHSTAPPISSVALAAQPAERVDRRRALAAVLTRNHAWVYEVDLLHAGFYWEAHEAYEAFWHALGHVTPEARFIQGRCPVAIRIRGDAPALPCTLLDDLLSRIRHTSHGQRLVTFLHHVIREDRGEWEICGLRRERRHEQQCGEERQRSFHGCVVIHFFGPGGRALIHARLKT